MKAVLMSIQPKWCELIASGKKTVEVRKSKPKLETPFKVYIYETKALYKPNGCKHFYEGRGQVIGKFVCDEIDDFYCASVPYRKENNLGYGNFVGNGVYKVDGWFEGVVFERSDPRIDTMLNNTDLENMCLSVQEIFDYIGIGKHLYGYHISDLVIYDEPKELSEFYVYCGDNPKCDGCETHYYSNTECGKEDYCCSIIDGCKPLTRPPQSWCYVESR